MHALIGTLEATAERTRLPAILSGIAGMAGLLARELTRATSPLIDEGLMARLRGGRGLEIGGPSHRSFGRWGQLPVYSAAVQVDNVSVHLAPADSDDERAGAAYSFDPDKRPGRQFLSEATSLDEIESASYDFVLSSHTLEHIANPLKALREWRRVLKPGGVLILAVSDPTRTPDRRRPVTTLQHLLDDDRREVAEDDATHAAEILDLYDFWLDPDLSVDRPAVADFCRRNLELRWMRHHVFDIALLVSALEVTGFAVIGAERALPDHLLVTAE
jgi:SAM-dependent methyltransferase